MGFVVGSVFCGVVWVLSGELYGNIGVGEGGVLVGRGPRGDLARLVYAGVGYAILGCSVDSMCGWGWDPRFALECIELVGAWLFPSVAWLTSPAVWAGC